MDSKNSKKNKKSEVVSIDFENLEQEVLEILKKGDRKAIDKVDKKIKKVIENAVGTNR